MLKINPTRKIKKKKSFKRLKRYASRNRRRYVECEIILKNALKEFEIPFTHQVVFHPYIVDFYFHERRLVVELDGPDHAKKIDYDKRRRAYLRSKKLKVVTFDYEFVKSNLHRILGTILSFKVSLPKCQKRFGPQQSRKPELCGHGRFRKWCCECRYAKVSFRI